MTSIASGGAEGFGDFNSRNKSGDPADVESWIKQARGGSAEAMTRLLTTYRNYLHVVAHHGLNRKLRAKEGASDVVARTEYAAHRAFAEFRGATEGEWRCWLLSILTNNLENLRRKFTTKGRNVDRELSIEEIGSQGPPALTLPSREGSPSERLFDYERAVALSAALERLPEHYRQAIRLRYWDKLGFEEIGESLGKSPEAARKLWARAILQLRKNLPVSMTEL